MDDSPVPEPCDDIIDKFPVNPVIIRRKSSKPPPIQLPDNIAEQNNDSNDTPALLMMSHVQSNIISFSAVETPILLEDMEVDNSAYMIASKQSKQSKINSEPGQGIGLDRDEFANQVMTPTIHSLKSLVAYGLWTKNDIDYIDALA
eukprot:791154_1